MVHLSDANFTPIKKNTYARPQWKILAVEELKEREGVSRKRKGGVWGTHKGHRGNQASGSHPQAPRCAGGLPSILQQASLQGEVMRATPGVGGVLGWGKGSISGSLQAGGECRA